MDETVTSPASVHKRVPAQSAPSGLLRQLALPLLLPLLMSAACARAQGLPDPTMPPPEARQALGITAAPPVDKGPQLQSVLVGSNGRQVAVIDGQTVRRGEKFNGALLVKVDKNHAVLRRGARTQVLTLMPDSPARNASNASNNGNASNARNASNTGNASSTGAGKRHVTQPPANDN